MVQLCGPFFSGELEFQLSISLTWGDAGEVCLDGLSPLCSQVFNQDLPGPGENDWAY